MNLTGKISENEMIAEFLKAEYSSERFNSRLKSLLDKYSADHKLITEPNLKNKDDNIFRKTLLGEYRGYGRNQELFENFPNDVQWHIALLTPEELKQAKYIAYDYWKELTDGSRLAIDAVKNIQAGKEIFNQSNERFLSVAEAIKNGVKFPRLIFLASDKDSSVVVLEGHLRLTAFLLEPEFIPKNLEVIVGFSKNASKWDLY
ncbi:MAG: hypothetical protein UR66_C0001G0082 [Candidatus Moranbacteria bacterium GW2011_GWE1_35_17]|nr:MAG: hypothetical protein UR66_C0001G0082 [Candidatus Moranbacteria bacterium GW2011_GWE1_35_17]KKP72747.1 MAG: hypothetical protein UR65_C0012G0012 [Candidatus Moranbacteria bacterium GW2011_GWE2_35_164]KKP81145.1 MAG: hypothetical protein UR82_C0071G0005 [Candidatus Moranbacteria bacterium GW2011_GWF1_35_5]KKP85199.1 MAG: hypothetical protein UR83_C0003G0034 [Candidatus Moranbacteria bacterium GW2011_GWF2_35_54]